MLRRLFKFSCGTFVSSHNAVHDCGKSDACVAFEIIGRAAIAINRCAVRAVHQTGLCSGVWMVGKEQKSPCGSPQ